MLGLGALDDELLAVASDDFEGQDVELRVDQVQELFDVSEQFLADPFACAVDAELDSRRAV